MQSVDDQRFETMTMPHVNALFQTALRLTENPAWAQEVVRETYECAWKSFCGREKPNWRLGLFKALMQRIHRRDRDWFGVLRVGKLEQASSEEGAPELDDTDTFSHSPELVISVLARVPIPLREIILLVDCQEFTYKEAAEILSLSTEAVAHRTALGRKHLLRELNGSSSPVWQRRVVPSTSAGIFSDV